MLGSIAASKDFRLQGIGEESFKEHETLNNTLKLKNPYGLISQKALTVEIALIIHAKL